MATNYSWRKERIETLSAVESNLVNQIKLACTPALQAVQQDRINTLRKQAQYLLDQASRIESELANTMSSIPTIVNDLAKCRATIELLKAAKTDDEARVLDRAL